jgi:hypothetical protein
MLIDKNLHTARAVAAAPPGAARLAVWRSALAVAGALLASLPLFAARSQESDVRVIQASEERRTVPFGAGEKLDYDVKFGFLHVGSGQMEVVGTENVRGREAWRARMIVSGGIPGYRVNDRLESWFDTRSFESLRFVQQLEQGRKDREYEYDIFPERKAYVQKGKEEKPSVEDPLDDAAFLYFVRTMPLEVGQTYELNRYFVPDRNPVTLRVVKKDTVEVPAGKFATIVVQPTFKSKGLFSKNGHALVWLTDDDRRLLVQMKSDLPIGSLNLYLKKIQPGSGVRTAEVGR